MPIFDYHDYHFNSSIVNDLLEFSKLFWFNSRKSIHRKTSIYFRFWLNYQKKKKSHTYTVILKSVTYRDVFSLSLYCIFFYFFSELQKFLGIIGLFKEPTLMVNGSYWNQTACMGDKSFFLLPPSLIVGIFSYFRICSASFSKAKVVNYRPWTKFGPPPVYANTILLEPSYTYSLTNYQLLLCNHHNRDVCMQKTLCGLQRQK